jgi:uncharacterized membrane protein YkoI
MKDKLKGAVIAAAVLAALGVGGVAIAGAARDDDESERPITGSAVDRASKAALDHTGGGKVTGTEVDDEEGKYEVEVTRGGSAVDVHLDAGFKVLGDEADSDSSEDEGANER